MNHCISFSLPAPLSSLFLSLGHAELFCMGFSFAAFFFFVLITRTTELDYDSESPPTHTHTHTHTHFDLLRLSVPTVKAAVCRITKCPPFISSCCKTPRVVCLRLSAVRLAVSVVIGVVGGVLLVMSWWRFGSVMACIVVVGLMLGFLVASTVLFTPLGRKEMSPS